MLHLIGIEIGKNAQIGKKRLAPMVDVSLSFTTNHCLSLSRLDKAIQNYNKIILGFSRILVLIKAIICRCFTKYALHGCSLLLHYCGI